MERVVRNTMVGSATQLGGLAAAKIIYVVGPTAFAERAGALFPISPIVLYQSCVNLAVFMHFSGLFGGGEVETTSLGSPPVHIFPL